ncbi:MAG: hypothetical protein M1831_007248 [Alyxoria varia]|nr:MAG: hypothetical protein M1831_007248 [Alyxoria varia]
MKASCFLVLAVAFANTAFALPSLFQEKQSSALSAVQKRGGAASIPGKDFTESDGTRGAFFKAKEVVPKSMAMPNDVKRTDGQGLEHPKVYVGFFKHAMFFDKKTSLTVGGAPQDEYRSDDWYYMGKLGKGDFVPDQTLEAYKGDYGAATSDPATIETSTCGW